jgi:hypothetical protein
MIVDPVHTVWPHIVMISTFETRLLEALGTFHDCVIFAPPPIIVDSISPFSWVFNGAC